MKPASGCLMIHFATLGVVQKCITWRVEGGA